MVAPEPVIRNAIDEYPDGVDSPVKRRPLFIDIALAGCCSIPIPHVPGDCSRVRNALHYVDDCADAPDRSQRRTAPRRSG